MHHVAIQRRRRPILGEQRDLPAALADFVKCLDRLTPGGSLAVVDLAQIQQVPLHRATAGHPAVLHNAPVAVLLAVLAANLVAQKHATTIPDAAAVSQATWSAPHAVVATSSRFTAGFSGAYQPAGRRNLQIRGRVAKVGLKTCHIGLTAPVIVGTEHEQCETNN